MLRLRPVVPSTCPFVTSVGYTQISPGNTTSQPEIALNQNIGGGTIFYSGGGFSNVFAIPGETFLTTVSLCQIDHSHPRLSEIGCSDILRQT
jgi:hypothetical protein